MDPRLGHDRCLRIHDLRHTAVALWIAAGASPKEVARRAGHTSVKTVLDVYGHLYDEADVALRERLEAMFVPVVAALPTDLCGPTDPRKPAVSSAAVRLIDEPPV
jgi:DNA-binding CsgD family transcriptional regulator